MRQAERYRNLSIKQKLRLIVVSTLSLALLVASLAVLTYEQVASRAGLQSDLEALAEIVGSNSTGALTFADQVAGEEILGGLKARRHIIAAFLFLSDGRFLSAYRAPSKPSLPAIAPRSNASWSEGSNLIVCRDITLRRQTVWNDRAEPQRAGRRHGAA